MNDEIREILARLSRYVITPDVRHDFDDLLEKINYLLNKRNDYLQDLLWTIREYIIECQKGRDTLDINKILKMLD